MAMNKRDRCVSLLRRHRFVKAEGVGWCSGPYCTWRGDMAAHPEHQANLLIEVGLVPETDTAEVQ